VTYLLSNDKNATEIPRKTLDENQPRQLYEFSRRYSMTDYVHVASITGVEDKYFELRDDD